MFKLIVAALLSFAPVAHAQYVGTCEEGSTYVLDFDEHNGEWSSADTDAFLDRYEQVPHVLRSGAMRLGARRVNSDSDQGTPAGIEDGSSDTLLFWDGFFDLSEAERQVVLNHELAHIWAFNHLCEFEDFSRIGWVSISREGRSGVAREGATYPARAGEEGTPYSASNPQEDFAVSVELYIQDPAGFARSYPERGAWISAYLLPARGCPSPVFLCALYELTRVVEYGPHEEDYYPEESYDEDEEEGMMKHNANDIR